jgi:hypothetical protein
VKYNSVSDTSDVSVDSIKGPFTFYAPTPAPTLTLAPAPTPPPTPPVRRDSTMGIDDLVKVADAARKGGDSGDEGEDWD